MAGEARTAVFRVEGQPTLEFTAVATDGPPPPHAVRPEAPAIGETIAIAVRDLATGQRLFCAHGLSHAGASAEAWMQEADCVLFAGVNGADGGAPDSPEGASVWLDGVRARRKLLMCRPDGLGGTCDKPELLAQRGIEYAADRMEIEL